MTSPTVAPPKPDIQIEVAPDQDSEVALDPPHRVLLHNDDFTPYIFVVNVLRSVFEFSWPRAVAVTQTAHVRGIAYVVTYPLEDAKYRVGQAHALARAEGYPLTLTIEPED